MKSIMDIASCKCLQQADHGGALLEAQVFLQGSRVCKPCFWRALKPVWGSIHVSCLMCSSHAKFHGPWHGHMMRQHLG